MTIIQNVEGRQIFDSRGVPTTHCTILLEDGTMGTASVPSGASTGTYEACELRDDDASKYGGRGVLKAIAHIEKEIGPRIIGMDVEDQHDIDQCMLALDGTDQKQKLGANAILAVSLAVARAASKYHHIDLYRYLGGHQANMLPTPMINVINGGQHANNGLDVQEFMIVPTGFDSFSEALRAGIEVFHALKDLLREGGHHTAVGDEGGFAPNLKNNREAMTWIMRAIEKAKYIPGEDMYLALDLASSDFYQDDCYDLVHESKTYSMEGWIDLMAEWLTDFPILSLEDAMSEKDQDGWVQLTEALGREVMLVGDDVFVTQSKRLQHGIDRKMANSILIKPNQVGTLTETLTTIAMAQKNNFGTVVSHRSGETEDTFIADLAVATRSGLIKTGGLCRSERMAKYNRLLYIEQALGQNAQFNRLASLATMGQP